MCMVFRKPSIISSTTFLTRVLWIQFFKIAFASDSVLASLIPHNVHSASNSLSHVCGTFSVFMLEPGGLATINWVTSGTMEESWLVFWLSQKLVSYSSSGISSICTGCPIFTAWALAASSCSSAGRYPEGSHLDSCCSVARREVRFSEGPL